MFSWTETLRGEIKEAKERRLPSDVSPSKLQTFLWLIGVVRFNERLSDSGVYDYAEESEWVSLSCLVVMPRSSLGTSRRTSSPRCSECCSSQFFFLGFGRITIWYPTHGVGLIYIYTYVKRPPFFLKKPVRGVQVCLTTHLAFRVNAHILSNNISNN